MKFKFKTQKYQTDAVNAVVNVFDGQPFSSLSTYTRDLGEYIKQKEPQQMSLFADDGEKNWNDDDVDTGYANSPIRIMPDRLLNNIKSIQSLSNIRESNSLVDDIGAVSLDVEMETGTGKTYVYIKTMYELNKKYGWSKFIVVVPSIAIREGVKKSFDITQDHFYEQYGKKIRYFIYKSDNLGKIDEFSSSNAIHVMIINIQAFNRAFKEGGKGDSLIIYSRRDDFQGRRPIDVIAKNKPIMILDEPQKMGGEKTQDALQRFNPLFAINYSATHREQHNLIYVLDALDAYNHKLVKKIEVKGFTVKNLRGTNGYLYLQDIVLSKNKPPYAKIELEVGYQKSINRETKSFDVGDNIYPASKEMEQYKDGYVISEINPFTNTVTFINGIVLKKETPEGDISENDIRRIQIRETIKSHFEKEREMFDKGIKVLSLFFIDEVAKYRLYDDEGNQLLGIYGQMFEEEYKKVLNENLTLFGGPYQEYLRKIKIEDTHKGYFSIDKKKHMVDPSMKKGSDESDDESAYELILQDKERLLSFEEPTRFIFSHSALREGWDNPNVFQICTLKHSSNDTQRHQEVGRGLRLCVNRNGDRMDASVQGIDIHAINKLTVIANESYEDFVSGLQSEVSKDLFDRPTKITASYFAGKKCKVLDVEGVETEGHKITTDESNEIYFYLVQNGYVDSKGHVTQKYKDNEKEGSFAAFENEILKENAYSIHQLIQRTYNNQIVVENANTPKVPNALNDNFAKHEFKELWNMINVKYAYTVDFNSDELISKAIQSIDGFLHVTRLVYTVSTGEQREEQTKEDIDTKQGFKTAHTRTESIDSFASETVKYDLLGKVCELTKLTRKTIAKILCNISPSKFAMYQVNPEEFISKVSRLINEEKASIIVEHISYNKTDEDPFDSEIFVQEKNSEDFRKAYNARKCIQDYVFTDGIADRSVERRFAEDLDNSDEVVVYAKLPKGFYIPTPLGNYTPDWAIAFKQGTVKHVYFIAETKGSMSSLQLRKIEDAKIDCASKLFASMSDKDIVYGKVDSFATLLGILRE